MPQSPQVVAALQQMMDAKKVVEAAMANMTPADVGQAFHDYGMFEMKPESAKFAGFNSQGQAMYKCAWYDDQAEGDGSFVTGTAFVWYDSARNKLLADT